MIEELKDIIDRLQNFTKEAHTILAIHETSPSRVVLLEDTYKQLKGLSLKQDDLFRQALQCIEKSLFRAAHVMVWAGFMDFLEEKISSDGFRKIKAARPNWNINTIDDLREQIPDYQIIEATRSLNLCTKNETKALLGLLNKRNECAHPSSYFPELNDSLGYVSELLQRIRSLMKKTI